MDRILIGALYFDGHSYPQIYRQLVKETFHSPRGLSSFGPENMQIFLHTYCRTVTGRVVNQFRRIVRGLRHPNISRGSEMTCRVTAGTILKNPIRRIQSTRKRCDK